MLNVQQFYLHVQPQDQVVSLWLLVVLMLTKLYVKQLRQILEILAYGIIMPVERSNVSMPPKELILMPNVMLTLEDVKQMEFPAEEASLVHPYLPSTLVK